MTIIEGHNYTLRLHEANVIETIYPDNTVVDEAMTADIDSKLLKLNPKGKFYILSEAQGFFMISPGLRKSMASENFSRPVAAVAFFSHEPKLNEVMETFNEKMQPKVPIKFFINKQDALHWLRMLRAADMPNP